MRILDIEKHFQDEKTLDKVLDVVNPDFETVDYWAGLLKEGMLSENPNEIARGIQELTGAYSNLRTTLALAIIEKTNRENIAYNSLRIATGKTEKKFVSASADRQASLAVNSYRRIRNIILGYKESAEKGVSSLQNINNNLGKTLKTHNE